jgi:hypothetical protein
MAKETIRSPQHEAIEELTWSRLPGFWSKNMDPSDRDALTAMYECYGNILDAEYVRLFDVNKAKSIETCPIFTQRRWLRLDLNRYDEMKRWLRFLAGGEGAALGSQAVTAAGSTTDTATCEPFATNHSKHWHINFPFIVKATIPEPLRRTIQFGYPIASGLVEIYRMERDAQSRRTGVRLLPNRDFEILPDGMSLRIKDAAPGERFEMQVGMDLGGEAYDGVRPTVFRVKTLLSPNVVSIPPQLDTGHPVHALIVRNPPRGSVGSVLRTNNDTFSTLREFIPYTGNAETGIQRGSIGQVVFPVSTTLSEDDIVFLFTTERGEHNALHQHERVAFRLDKGNANPFGTLSFIPPVAVQRGLFGTVGLFGHELQLYIDGNLISPEEYRYDVTENRFELRLPVTFKYGVNVGIHFSSELRADPTKVSLLHLHSSCFIEKTETEKVYDRFDDGGEYDDDTDPQPFFDSKTATNIVYVPVALDLDALEVYANGELTRPGADYVARVEGNQTRISFSIIIEGKSVLIAAERRSAIYAYNVDDILGFSGGGYGFSFESLSGTLNDLTSLVDTFKSSYGSNLRNLSALIDAANVAASGGNPILTLFYDEYPEYAPISPDSELPSITGVQARNIESSNTSLIAIPFLVDHVNEPTVRLDSGVDFTIENGGILSSQDLAAPRSEDDDNPGVWWCPVVLLDEHLLAKNFGTLVDDIQDSTPRYREMLQANLRLRYGGPVMENLQDAANVMLGTDAFKQDARVLGVEKETVGWTVTLVGAEASFQQVETLPADTPLPKVGQPVVPGQSIPTPAIYTGTLRGFLSFENRTLVIPRDINGPRPGDVVRLQLFDPSDLTIDPVWVFFTLTGIDHKPVLGGAHTLMTLDVETDLIPLESSRIIVLRDVGAPYAAFEGAVTDVSPIEKAILRTENEAFAIPLDYASAYQPGDYVRRGDPLDPRLAQVYDDYTRPDWHWLRPTDMRRAWGGLLGRNQRALRPDGLQDERFVTVRTDPSGYGRITPSPTFPSPPRGSVVTMRYDDNITEKVFTVIGTDGSEILVAPDPGEDASGTAVFEAPVDRAGERRSTYFEVPADRRADGGQRYTTLRTDHRAGGPTLLINPIVDWPAAGAVHILLPDGGHIEVEYHATKETQLYDLQWPTDYPSLTSSGGVFDPRIPAGCKVVLVWEYKARRLNPVFVDLVQRRVERDYSTRSGVPYVDDDNADAYYQFFKSSSAVLSTAKVGRPESLVKAIYDTLPPGTTLVIESRHVINEVWQPGARDNTVPADRVTTFHPMLITFTSPNGTVDVNELHVDENSEYISLAVAVADPDSGSVEVQWSVRAIRGSSAGLRLSDPTGFSTQLEGLVPAGRYYVTVDAENALGQKKSSTLIVVADI